MPFDEDLLICNVERFDEKRDAVEQVHVDVALFATIDPYVGVDAIPELAAAGACAFKFSTFEAHPKRFPRTPTPMLLDAFRLVAKTGLIACAHNEESRRSFPLMLERAAALGMTGPETHAWTRPPVNEAMAMLEIYELGVTAGVHAHVVHCSIPRGIEICESYKRQGHRVSVDLLLPFFFLTDEDVMGCLRKDQSTSAYCGRARRTSAAPCGRPRRPRRPTTSPGRKVGRATRKC